MILILIVPMLYAFSTSENINKIMNENEELISKFISTHQHESGDEGGGILYTTTKRFIFVPNIFSINHHKERTIFIDNKEIYNIDLSKEENTFVISIKGYILKFRLVNPDDTEELKKVKSRLNIDLYLK